jgi:predicted  nucleic acid-binding Zn-ribbon protein
LRFQKRLKQLEAEQEVLQKEIAQRKELLTRVDGEVERVEEQAGRMQEAHAKLSKEVSAWYILHGGLVGEEGLRTLN